MKTSIISQLRRVAPHLYRHKVNLTFYGVKKVKGRRIIHPLKTEDDAHVTDKAMAFRLLGTWLTDLQAEAIDPKKANMNVGELLALFMAVRAGKQKGTRGAEKSFAKCLRQTFDLPPGGKGMELLVSKVAHSHIVIWLNRIFMDADGKPMMRHSTYNRYRLFISQMFQFAEMEGIIAKSPFEPKQIRRKGKQRVIRLVPSEAEFTNIVAEIRKPTWEKANEKKRGGQRPLNQPESADFAEFLGLAGVGQGEASTLDWGDVDWTQSLVHYTRMKTGRPFFHPIYGKLRPLLVKLHEEADKPTRGAVFAIKSVRKALEGACARLKLPHFTQRSLRAYLIGRLWKAGVDVKMIAKWQGHSDGGKLILDTYTEVFGSQDASYEAAQIAKANGVIVEAPPPLMTGAA